MTLAIARDISCPKCGYPETYQEMADDGSAGCRRCGWRVRLDVLDSLTPSQDAAYWEAVKRGHVYVTARGRLAYETPGRRQYALPTLQRLRHLGLVEQRAGGEYGAWYPVDTAATQWQLIVISTGDRVRYVPTKQEALRAVAASPHLTYAAPRYVPAPPAPEKVAVELSRDDWRQVLAAFAAAAPQMSKGRHAAILTALHTATKED